MIIDLMDELSKFKGFDQDIILRSKERNEAVHQRNVAIALALVFLPAGFFVTFSHIFSVLVSTKNFTEVTNPLALGVQVALIVALIQAIRYVKNSLQNYKVNFKDHVDAINHLHKLVMQPLSRKKLLEIAEATHDDPMKVRALKVAYALPMKELKYKENIVIHALKLANTNNKG